MGTACRISRLRDFSNKVGDFGTCAAHNRSLYVGYHPFGLPFTPARRSAPAHAHAITDGVVVPEIHIHQSAEAGEVAEPPDWNQCHLPHRPKTIKYDRIWCGAFRLQNATVHDMPPPYGSRLLFTKFHHDARFNSKRCSVLHHFKLIGGFLYRLYALRRILLGGARKRIVSGAPCFCASAYRGYH